MKITKTMDKTCLREISSGSVSDVCTRALIEIGWTRAEVFDYDETGFINMDQLHTALAMCAAIAGVKP